MVFCTKPGTELTFSKSVLNEKKRKKSRYLLLIPKSLLFHPPHHHHHHQNKAILLHLGTFAKELPKYLYLVIPLPVSMCMLPTLWTTIQ